MRARTLGLQLPGNTGLNNAITDVAGIAVGYRTIIENEPRPGRKKPLRSGVTAIIPHHSQSDPVITYAGISRFNGNGEMTGSHWIEDGGYFVGPVLITNTHAVGIAHHAAIGWMIQRFPKHYADIDDPPWIMPIVAETYDGVLSDINGQHITSADVISALDAAKSGPIAEGCVGGGTGMICYGYKGGTGTSSRVIDVAGQAHTVGVLVQANHGERDWFTVLGVPVGKIWDQRRAANSRAERGPAARKERGSIIVVIATDIPMAPHQLKRLARRGAIGIGRGGTPGGNSSGDIFLALSTSNPRPLPHLAPARSTLEIINDDLFDPIYLAAVEAIEEAVLNAMLAAKTMGGTPHDTALIEALPHDQLLNILRDAQPASVREEPPHRPPQL